MAQTCAPGNLYSSRKVASNDIRPTMKYFLCSNSWVFHYNLFLIFKYFPKFWPLPAMCVQYEIQHGRLRLPARLPPAFQNRPVLAPAAVESQGLLLRLSHVTIYPDRPAHTPVFIYLNKKPSKNCLKTTILLIAFFYKWEMKQFQIQIVFFSRLWRFN